MWAPLPCADYMFPFDTPNSDCRPNSVVWGLYTFLLVDGQIFRHSTSLGVPFTQIDCQHFLLFSNWNPEVTRVCLWFFFISFMSPESAPVRISVDIFSGFAWWEMSIHIICPILIKSEVFDVVQVPSTSSVWLLLRVDRWQHLLSFMMDFIKKPLRSMHSYLSILLLCLCLWYIITYLYYLCWLSGKGAHVSG